MKKILCIMLTAIMFVGCQEKKDDNNVKIGVILPMTGDLSFLGTFMQNSLMLADTGDDVSYIFEDCGGDPKQAVLATNKLINSDDVSAIISSLSYLSEAINPILAAKDIPHFILSFSPKLWEEKNVIQSFVSTKQEAEMFVKYIKDNQISSVAFLRHQEPDASYGYDHYIKPALDSMNVSIVDVVFNNQTVRDFKNDILKVKDSNAELLIIQSLAYNIPNIIAAINTYDLNIPLLGDLNFLDIQDSQTRSLVENIPFIGIDYLLTKNYKLYQEEYVSKYNVDAFALGTFAHDLSILLRESVVLQETAKPAIIDRLNHLDRINGTINDKIIFDSNGQLMINYCIMKYSNGGLAEFEQ